MSYRALTDHIRVLLVTALGVVVCVLALGGSPGPGAARAAAQESECDAQCWSILAFLVSEGLTQQEIEDLGNSGTQPDQQFPVETTPTETTPTETTPTETAPVETAPVLTTTPAVTTPPAVTGMRVCDDPAHLWACEEVNDGIGDGYLPPDFNVDQPTEIQELREIIELFGNQNDDFDEEAALGALTDAGDSALRGDMLNALAAGLGIPYDPEDPDAAADELAALGILHGHDDDPDTVNEADTDSGSTMFNAQLAVFLSRIEEHTDPGHTGDTSPVATDPVATTPQHPTRPQDPSDPQRPTSTPPVDPGAAVCEAGWDLTGSQRSSFGADLRWVTLVDLEANGPPGQPWPPHREVPGGADFLVVSQSPVWPVVADWVSWHVVDAEDCWWVATAVQTRATEMLPWRPSHRSVLEDAAASRPDTGIDVFLRRWDNLTAAQQAQAQQLHRHRDVSARCPLAAARVGEDSYRQCRWELPGPGVWLWQAQACFEADTGDATYAEECRTLRQGVDWFLRFVDYTDGITAQAGRGAGRGPDPLDTTGEEGKWQ